MKLETRLKRALETPEPKLRLLRLHNFCLISPPGCALWNIARAEIEKLENEGVKICAK